ncbi:MULTISPECIES: methylated-DNA--[protein]-cysteine S-methyltransferase [unclassified Ruminococcus]|uniref:methylated-DNA--[protein]-cysteine S-methyltransferase n=1 Tax=unclassified Ruminococcus TaxID=2608920 RepID=UPI0021097E59|nr:MULTISPECIES: methylated-DNA--[protein]-cysteine S-methyltransferase [unclassified Ruminococcus]MCQ4022302.1 methylated-DNA--[protein]-cysteine S-methyltransferase [Ruminococcus sp. zg-924]MCQ4114630.1 methylated-DNA--[protein]-cysteine S-methyltransferase [Ruminococcus sp. zg-921]
MAQSEYGNIKHKLHFNTPIGTLCIQDDGKALTALYIDSSGDTSGDFESDLLKRTKIQIMEYFDGIRQEFDIPLNPKGTQFQLNVWSSLQKIPYAQTRSYSDIAGDIGRPNSCRAVGGANGKNPIMIIIPCHRVIGKSGSLVGFSAGMEVKKYLLALEQATK